MCYYACVRYCFNYLLLDGRKAVAEWIIGNYRANIWLRDREISLAEPDTIINSISGPRDADEMQIESRIIYNQKEHFNLLNTDPNNS